MAPNIDISSYRRCYATSEKIAINLQGFNVKSVSFTAYRLDLGRLVQNSAGMDDFGKTEKKINTRSLSAAASWTTRLRGGYIDQWDNVGSSVPKLAHGAYLIVARAKGVEKRTWLAVTNSSLLVKRSSSELLIFAADIVSGAPLAHVGLTVSGKTNELAKCETGADGIARIRVTVKGNVWINGDTNSGPAFALSGEVTPPDPYVIYAITDRPIYRPGSLVEFKATVRRWIASPSSPGRFRYEPYANSPAVIEFRDSTDALVERRTVTTNGFGSLNGVFPLASECGQGDWHINVVLGDFTSYLPFTVQSYRKPEMTVTFAFDKQRYICGGKAHAVLSAQYVYGRPVVGATVKYSVSYNGGTGSFDAVGTTDSQGNLSVDVQTARLSTDQNLSIRATVTDLSRRSYTASADTLIAAGAFRLSLSSDKDVYKTGSRINMTVSAADYDDNPVAAQTKVTMTETKEDNQHRAYSEYTTKDVRIGAGGSGAVAFSCPRPGTLDFVAVAYDGQNDKISAETSVDVSDKEPQPAPMPTPPSLELKPNKKSYSPGDTAAIRVNTTLVGIKYASATKTMPEQPAHPDAWALVTVEGEQLGMASLQHLTNKQSTIKIPLTSLDFPSVELHVEVIEDHTVTDQEITLPVERKQRDLTVSVVPDKKSYQPGDTASYKVTTLDYLGRPVPAEVSLAVVDESIYDIKPDSSPEIETYFYTGQTVRIQTDFSFAAQYSGGGFQNAGGIPGVPPTAGGIRVRKNFADTAYWAPDVVTGGDGTATVSFTIPDNLTTWRTTAHAISKQTAVGSAKNDVVAVMPLLVKIEMPRFVVQGDNCIFSAIVQNGTKVARSVKVTASVSGASITGPAQTTIDVPAGGQQRLDWPASIAGPNSTVFDVVADGGVGGQDAAETAVPVLPSALKMVTVKADELNSANPAEIIDLSQLPDGAGFQLILSSSLAGSLADSVKELVERPDDDAEFAASALTADVALSQALSASRRKPNRDVQRDVILLLQKLYLYQHPDGGWNLWEFDQSDGDITASVLDALISAKTSGFAVDPQRILRGSTSLKNLISNQQDPESRVSWLAVLSRSADVNPSPQLESLYKIRDEIDDYGKASLAFGLFDDRNSNDTSLAQNVLTDIIKDSVTEGRAVSWPARQGVCPWEDDDVAVTAHVLQALLKGQPTCPLIPGAVRWLMANRGTDNWDVSAADALAISALSEYLRQTGDTASHCTTTVSMDGKPLGSMSSDGVENSLVVTLTPALLTGHKELEIKESGTGTVYVDREERYLIPIEQAKALASGIAVARHYVIALEDPSLAQKLPSATPVTVRLDINADAGYRYVRIEDALPAGCEVEGSDNPGASYPIDYSDGAVSYANEDIRDNQVVFSFDNLPKGHTTLSYQLDTEQPGTYTICPSIASLNYFPEVRGNSGFAHIVIVDQP
jgi:uncharacterized protein YfaS (alpha-2-macroglobulin family)